jgi:hypothetical protein
MNEVIFMAFNRAIGELENTAAALRTYIPVFADLRFRNEITRLNEIALQLHHEVIVTGESRYPLSLSGVITVYACAGDLNRISATLDGFADSFSEEQRTGFCEAARGIDVASSIMKDLLTMVGEQSSHR